MKTYIDNKLGFSFLYPKNWDLEKDENIISLFEPKLGFGVLQISTYYVNNPEKINLNEELNEYLEDYKGKYLIKNKNSILCTELNMKNRFWKYWIFVKGTILVFVTYNCSIEDKGKEEVIYDSIIKTFTLARRS